MLNTAHGAQATRRSNAQARERRPPVGTAARCAASGTNVKQRDGLAATRPSTSAVVLVGDTPQLGCTQFACLRRAVPTPTGRTGRRSAFPCLAAPSQLLGVRAETGAIPTIWVFAAAALRAAVPTGGRRSKPTRHAADRRSAFRDRRHHLDGRVPVRPALSQQRAGSPCSLSDTPSGRSGSALHG